MKLATFAMLPLLLAPQTPTQPPKPRPAPQAAAPVTAVVTVTDSLGTPLSDVHVLLTGSLDRSGATAANGTVKFDGLRPGTYRLRFEKTGFTTFEREIEVRAGQPAPTPAVTLTPAPPPPPPPAPPPPVQTVQPPPPAGTPVVVSIPDFYERNQITSTQPQKVTQVGCSGWGNTVLWQIREPWTDRQHERTEAMLYIVGGEGVLRLDGRDHVLTAGSFAQVPRGAAYSLTRRGRNPVLIVLATLVGEGCP